MRKRTFILHDVVDIPNSSPLVDVLVTIDLLLLERPVWKEGFIMCPHRHARWPMNEAEVARFGLPWGAVVVIKRNFEQSVVETIHVLAINCRKFLIRGHQG
jgi:hypothetical protein